MMTVSLTDLVTILSGSGILGGFGFLGKRFVDRRRSKKEDTNLDTKNFQILTSTNINQLEYMRNELEQVQKDLKETQETLKETREMAAEIKSFLRSALIELRTHRELTTGEQRIVDGY